MYLSITSNLKAWPNLACALVYYIAFPVTVLGVQRFAGWLSEENRQGVACGFNTIITIAHVTTFCTQTPKVTLEVTHTVFGGKSVSQP